MGQRQSSSTAAGIGMRKFSSAHQQAPLRPPLPHSNIAPQRMQARRRIGVACATGSAFMSAFT